MSQWVVYVDQWPSEGKEWQHLSPPQPCFLNEWKAARFLGHFSNPGACHLPNEWPSFLDSWTSQSMMPQDKRAHSFASHCRLISVGPFAYLYGTTLVKRNNNNNNAWNTLWIFYFRLILMMTQHITHNSQCDWSCSNHDRNLSCRRRKEFLKMANSIFKNEYLILCCRIYINSYCLLISIIQYVLIWQHYLVEMLTAYNWG